MSYVLALQIASMSITKGWDEAKTKKVMADLFTRIAKQSIASVEKFNPAYDTEQPATKTLH